MHAGFGSRLGAGRLAPVALAALVTAIALTAGGASADTTSVDDGRNARANLFDIKRATAGHRGKRLRHTVETVRAWRSRELRMSRRRPRIICIYVWKRGRDTGGRQDFEICASFRKRKLRGTVLQVRPKRRSAGKATVRRLSRRSISYDFDAETIGDPSSYQWQAVSGYTGKGCPKDPPFQFGCDDSAPTGATRLHDLLI